MQRKSNRALIVAVGLAIAVASAGTATAGSLITGAAVKDGSLTGADLRNGSVQLADLAPSIRRAITARQITGRAGAQGPVGPQGPAGIPGATGGLDASRITTVVGPVLYVAPGGVDGTTVYCPMGQKATGGGFSFVSAGGTAFGSRPTPGADGWNVLFDNYPASYTAGEGQAYAVCVAP